MTLLFAFSGSIVINISYSTGTKIKPDSPSEVQCDEEICRYASYRGI